MKEKPISSRRYDCQTIQKEPDIDRTHLIESERERIAEWWNKRQYEGQPYGFFHFGNREYYVRTVTEIDRFLASLGYLQGEPTIQMEEMASSFMLPLFTWSRGKRLCMNVPASSGELKKRSRFAEESHV